MSRQGFLGEYAKTVRATCETILFSKPQADPVNDSWMTFKIHIQVWHNQFQKLCALKWSYAHLAVASKQHNWPAVCFSPGGVAGNNAASILNYMTSCQALYYIKKIKTAWVPSDLRTIIQLRIMQNVIKCNNKTWDVEKLFCCGKMKFRKLALLIQYNLHQCTTLSHVFDWPPCCSFDSLRNFNYVLFLMLSVTYQAAAKKPC